jgi:hypothetical protein
VSEHTARTLLVLAFFGAVVAAGAAAAPPNVSVTASGGQVQGARLALDPRNRRRLAAVYWDDSRERRGTCSIALSSNGGATWTNRAFAGDGTANPLPSGMTLCRAPVVAYGSGGTLYVAYEVAQLSGFGQVELARSTNGGVTFDPALLLDPDAAGGGDRDPSIAVGARSRVYVSFQRYSADEEQAGVALVTSTDSGRTVSAPTSVSPPEQNAAGSRAALAAGSGGALYAGWVDGSDVDADGGGTVGIEVASSGDGGLSFGSARAVAEVPSGCGPNDDCGNRYPAVTLASAGARRVVAAWNAAAYPEPSRISVARSTDSGRSWSAGRALPLSSGSGDRDQYGPDLGAAPDGRLDIAYLDQARDADNGLLDVEVAHSIDGGKTFRSPLRIDDGPSVTQRAGFVPSVSVGSSNTAATGVWIDGRRGTVSEPETDAVFAARSDSQAPRAPVVRGSLVVRSRRPVVYRLSSMDAFTPAAALRFRCGLDGAALRPCTARLALRLAPGRHTLSVRALDGAGNRSAFTRVGLRVLLR